MLPFCNVTLHWITWSRILKMLFIYITKFIHLSMKVVSHSHFWNTLNSTYNEQNYAEIFLCYRWLFVKGKVIIDDWGIFGV